MSHSERIQEAAKEIDDAFMLSYDGRAEKIAAIISKHIPDKPKHKLGCRAGFSRNGCTCPATSKSENTPHSASTTTAPKEHIPEQNELREIALLIGSIFFHGNFKAETFNERELEKLLRKNGYFFETEDELLRSLATPSEPLGVTKQLGVEPVPTISSNAGVPMRPQEGCMSEKADKIGWAVAERYSEFKEVGAFDALTSIIRAHLAPE